MPYYEFTDQAETDLDGITDYTINRWGKAQANQYIDGLEDLAQILADSPDLGVNRPALFEELISFPYARHILYYVEQPHGITIIRVLHKKMDVKKHITSTYEVQ
jgi:toxin ParE1/3/4